MTSKTCLASVRIFLINISREIVSSEGGEMTLDLTFAVDENLPCPAHKFYLNCRVCECNEKTNRLKKCEKFGLGCPLRPQISTLIFQ